MPSDLRDTKVGRFISLLSPEEQKRLAAYLQSPYFKVSDAEFQLYQILVRSIRKDSLCSAERTGDQLFPNSHPKSVRLTRLKKLRSKLLARVLDFLVLEEMQRSPLRPAHLLSGIARIKGVELFDHYHRRSVQQVSDAPVSTLSAWNKFILQLEAAKMHTLVQRDIEGTLAKAYQHLLEYSHTEGLRLLIAQYNLKRMVRQESDPALEEKLSQAIQLVSCSESVLAQIYSQLGLLLLTPDLGDAEPYYQRAFDLVLKEKNLIATDELTEITYFLFNYCAWCLNNAKFEKLEQYLTLNRILEEAGIFEPGPLVHPSYFKNLIEVIQKSHGRSGVLRVLEQHGVKDPMVNAIAAFHAQKYSDCLRFSNTIQLHYRNVFYTLTIKSYRLMAMFELGLVEGVLDGLHAFEMYLLRHDEVPAQYMTNYKRFLSSMREFLNATWKNPYPDTERLGSIQSQLVSSPYFSWETWLLEQVSYCLKQA